MTLLHATAVARHGAATLITGPSGAGKSDLALRLVDRGWTLVADDYVRLNARAGRLVAHTPPATRGLLEVRGLGLVRLPWTDRLPVALLVDLGRAPPRHPDLAHRAIAGVAIPALALDPRPASAAIVVELAFARARATR